MSNYKATDHLGPSSGWQAVEAEKDHVRTPDPGRRELLPEGDDPDGTRRMLRDEKLLPTLPDKAGHLIVNQALAHLRMPSLRTLR
jgi:hypothetical protein